ncbi:MAG: hypothetical protein K5768_08460 [Firmicutes bacterium]|nr:hypothetical protein [Bacillota bacterium]
MAHQKDKVRSRNFMYTQQLAHLPNNMTPEDVYNRFLGLIDDNNVAEPKIKVAYIVHDKDLKPDGKTPAEPHIHLMIHFENARSVNSLADYIGDEPQRFEIFNDRYQNGFAYLIHETRNASEKYRYSADNVIANFDYAAMIKETAEKITLLSVVRENALLDMVGTGEISLIEAKSRLKGSEYAKMADKLKKAHELFLERKSDELHAQMVVNDEIVAVHWFYGESETGKSYLAETLAKEMGVPYYKTTTSKDPFQFYQAEPIIILDELRPEIIPYSELLALFDPFSRGKISVSSRYVNKALACKTIFVTTPYSPSSFYSKYKLSGADKGEQLYRRLSSILLFDMDLIHDMEYQRGTNGSLKERGHKPNQYSKKNQAEYKLVSVFDMIE